MMQKRTLYSLLIISFIVVFAASMATADTIRVQTKNNLPRCADQAVNVTADITSAGVSAIELVLEINQTSGDCATPLTNIDFTWGLGADVLTNRVVEIQSDGVAPDTIRAAAMYVDNGSGLGAGNGQLIGTITFHTADCCAAVASINNTVFDYPNETCDITTTVVDADGQNTHATFVPGVVSIANQLPTVDAISDVSVAWGDPVSLNATATDNDVANGCESLTFSKVAGPATLTVSPSGAIAWATTGADVCDHEVTVKVTDACGAEDTETFNVCVTNEAPVITCPDDQLVFAGATMTVQATAVDPDGGPHSLVYSLASTDFPGTVTVNPASGMITMPTDVVPEQTGVFQVCVAVSDSANVCDPCSPANADTCCFTVEVRSMAVYIQKVHDQIQGQVTTVSIDMLGGEFNNWEIGGYDLLIAYDNSALSFLNAEPGDFFTSCNWEYFTYRQGYNGNCANGCPTGVLRIVALAEQNNGNHHPTCYDNSGNGETQLASLSFLVTNDHTFNCMYVPIKFWWVDCGDNGFSSKFGDTLLISRWVYDYYGDNGVDTWVHVEDLGASLPSYYGAPSECDTYTAKGEPVRAVDFYNGGVDIVCSDSIDATGDINMNGIAYEIADAVMFTNYFVHGLSAFSTHSNGSIAASDANQDGIPLTVADLVYLIRVVIGDAQPYAKVDAIRASYTFENSVLSIDQDMAAVHVVFQGNVNVELLAPNMEMQTGLVDGNTHVLVYPDFESGDAHQTFSGDFLRADGQLMGQPEFATPDGYPVAAKNVPRSFHVEQNYPNPFNPTTTIEFALPKAGEWNVDIYNVAGQLVNHYNGAAEAGYVKVEWNASNLASGVYFYRVTSGSASKTMKAILLK